MRRHGLLAVALLVCAACGGSTEPGGTNAPASIELSSNTMTVYTNRTTLLPTATVFNSSHEPITYGITWKSSDTSRAVKVQAGPYFHTNEIVGNVTLTAYAASASAALHVQIARSLVYGIIVSPPGTVLNGNDSVQFHAVAVDVEDDVVPGRVITWASLDPTIATISATGLAHIHGSGNARITASTEGLTDTVGIAADSRLVARITFDPDTLALVPGAHSQPFIIRTYDAAGNELVARSLTFTSSDSSIASVTFHDAFAKRVGSATITVHADTASLRIPVTVATVSFISVATGGSHACGLTPAHKAYCWGYDGIGQLGTTPFLYEGDAAPAPVRGGLSFATLAAGDNWTCGLIANGTPYCWGGVDQVGNGSLTPKKINGVTLQTLSITGRRACGLDATGSAWCWNGGDHERLLFIPPAGCGNDCDWTPVPVGNGTHWTMLSAGQGVHICGVVAGNVGKCWGSNFSGQIGDGTRVDDSVPVVVHGGLAFANISAGSAFTCGVTTDGDAYCWGSDTFGALGNGVPSPTCSEGNQCITLPKAVAGGHKFSFVRAAEDHACGLTPAGAVYCWGYSNFDSTPTVPHLLSGGVTFTSLESNGYDCGMATDGKLYCMHRDSDPTLVLGQ